MTYVRTAFFEGELTQAEKEDFYQYMLAEVAPIIASFPNSLGLEVDIPHDIESDSHKNLLLMLRHSYASKDVMLDALKSDRRLDSMVATKVIIEKYNIHVHHINFERQ
jgi:hypothetical protein